MKRLARILFASALAALAVTSAGPAHAWEAQTTNAGITESAAASSHLHDRLRELGFSGGLYEPLTVPPADAVDLMKSLARFAPTGGFVPDKRGRQFAINWLVAGAVLADSSPSWSVNHFYDPTTGKGATLRQAFVSRLRERIAESRGRPSQPASGVPAPHRVSTKDNPLGMDGFLDQYAKAIRGGTAGERGRAMAGALIAAGAILHVLEDMGSPSHVRDDLRSHLERLGPERDDLGSRFERIAALAYGRLGVPGADPVERASLRAFFTDADGKGLADWTASSFFSASTLPRPLRIGDHDDLASRQLAALVKPAPALPARLNLLAASGDDNATLSVGGVCRARYHVDKGVVRFSTDDECMLQQVDAILPQVVGYSAGLLDWLFRGDLEVTADPGAAGKAIVVARTAIGAGTLEVLAEDARGVRTSVSTVSTVKTAEGDALATVDVPAGARAVYVLFTGVDGAGEGLVAVGTLAEAAEPAERDQ
jgi:hypothetical protein